ncbi:hypothetical protein P7K49_033518 [Saguinus oedipus]|uniref:Uncharacterized protein n=1 Tax=Saguinus oedipus TaxID=9490 RepID=A0ABQ9TS60_SAGOE|nr:hypothetical protein P7K49_033518 [Saguinus oedipus]
MEQQLGAAYSQLKVQHRPGIHQQRPAEGDFWLLGAPPVLSGSLFPASGTPNYPNSRMSPIIVTAEAVVRTGSGSPREGGGEEHNSTNPKATLARTGPIESQGREDPALCRPGPFPSRLALGPRTPPPWVEPGRDGTRVSVSDARPSGSIRGVGRPPHLSRSGPSPLLSRGGRAWGGAWRAEAGPAPGAQSLGRRRRDGRSRGPGMSQVSRGRGLEGAGSGGRGRGQLRERGEEKPVRGGGAGDRFRDCIVGVGRRENRGVLPR